MYKNPGFRILLVEDNEGEAYIVRRVLEQQQIVPEVIIAHDGEEACRYLDGAEVQPDLVLLDLNLPRLNGFEVLNHIRVEPELAQTPVIMMSNSVEPEDRQEALSRGANAFFGKPSKWDGYQELGSLVHQVMKPTSKPN